jgi:hypothetical protein
MENIPPFPAKPKFSQPWQYFGGICNLRINRPSASSQRISGADADQTNADQTTISRRPAAGKPPANGADPTN